MGRRALRRIRKRRPCRRGRRFSSWLFANQDARDSGEVREELQVAPARRKFGDRFSLTEADFERQNSAGFEHPLCLRDQAPVYCGSRWAAEEGEGGFPVAHFAL